jgi:hypothetical protein
MIFTARSYLEILYAVALTPHATGSYAYDTALKKIRLTSNWNLHLPLLYTGIRNGPGRGF